MSTDDDNGNHECQGAVTYCCVSAEHCSGGHFLPGFSLYIPHMLKCVSESFAFGAFFCCPRSHPCKFNKEQF